MDYDGLINSIGMWHILVPLENILISARGTLDVIYWDQYVWLLIFKSEIFILIDRIS